jgi:hypothetical protein
MWSICSTGSASMQQAAADAGLVEALMQLVTSQRPGVRRVQQARLLAQEAAAVQCAHVRCLQGRALLRRALPAAALAGALPYVRGGGAAAGRVVFLV